MVQHGIEAGFGLGTGALYPPNRQIGWKATFISPFQNEAEDELEGINHNSTT